MTHQDSKNSQQTMKRCYGLTVILLAIGPIFLLTGCSTTSETFDTGAVEGVGAKSITQVNAMIDHGEMGGTGHVSTLKTAPPVFSTFDAGCVDVEAIELSNKTLTYRHPEKHRRVWIAPFQDARGNLHEGSVVHTVIRQGYWQLGHNPFYPKSS